jgi:peptidyl-prolyl cis-trans isomerase SurA
VSQILKLPPSSDESVKETKIKLDKLKERVLKGESFATLAILYSEDPGSSRNGGLYTGIKRGMFVKEFENVMYSLEEKEISDVFKTEYGYHIVQMEERRGVEVDVRHILMSPKISNSDLNLSKEDLMEVRDSILDGNLTFETACLFHSDDTDTKFNGGKLINPNTGNSIFELHELPNSIKISVESLNVGDISSTNYLKSEDGKESYTIYKLFSRKEAHEANLKDDYKKIRDLALEFKKDQSITEWINTSLLKTYVRISDQYESLVFQYNWLKE